MEKQLSSREWITDGEFSIADISLLAYTRVADEGGFDLSNRPHVQRWIKGCEDRLKLD